MPEAPAQTFSAIGRSLPRPDGGEKVAGATRYAADIRLPGMLHCRLVLSPHAHALIRRVDGKAAVALPGVLGVYTARDLPLAKTDPADRNRCPLALDRVQFVGHPVAAVVAETEAAAEDGAALVEVEYEEMPAAVEPLGAMAMDAPRVRVAEGGSSEEALAMHGAGGAAQAVKEQTGPNVSSTTHFTRGDVTKGFAESAVIVERTYTTPVVHQGYLEPRAAVANIEPTGQLTVWTTTQALFYTRSEVGEALGLPEHQVRVIATPLGGGFGGKFILLEPLVAALALKLRRPVGAVMTRTEEFLAATPAPQCRIEVKTGARKDGTLAAVEGRIVFDAGAFPGAPVMIAALMLGGYYRFEHMDVRGYEVLTHKVGQGAYRAPRRRPGVLRHRGSDGRDGPGARDRRPRLPHPPLRGRGRPHEQRPHLAAHRPPAGAGAPARGARHTSAGVWDAGVERKDPSWGGAGGRGLDGRHRTR
jgi:CO/xanthine dehydrogenase Mo-binding subunit